MHLAVMLLPLDFLVLVVMLYVIVPSTCRALGIWLNSWV